MRFLLAILLALLAAAPAVAGDLVVQVRTASGAPVPDAVVTLYPGGRASPLGPAGSYQIAQRNMQFSPFVLVVPVGADVSFPNFDNVRHHVYSFSPVRRFELRLYAREQARSVHFDRPGIVPLGCNIHDRMITHLYVSDAPWVAKSDAQGHATFADLPAGHYQMRAWHPQLRPGKQQPDRAVDVGDGTTTVTFELPLLPDPRPDAGDREHSRY